MLHLASLVGIPLVRVGRDSNGIASSVTSVIGGAAPLVKGEGMVPIWKDIITQWATFIYVGPIIVVIRLSEDGHE